MQRVMKTIDAEGHNTDPPLCRSHLDHRTRRGGLGAALGLRRADGDVTPTGHHRRRRGERTRTTVSPPVASRYIRGRDMRRDEIQARVADAMNELFDLDRAQVRPDARLREDLDLDSLDAVDLAAHMQTVTGRRFTDADLRRIRTVGDVLDLVERDLARP